MLVVSLHVVNRLEVKVVTHISRPVGVRYQTASVSTSYGVLCHRPRHSTFQKDHPKELIIGDMHAGVQKRRMKSIYSLLSQVEPKSVDEALKDKHWVKAMN